MTIKALTLAATLIALTATSGLAATVKLNVVDGHLPGAWNVPVLGKLYDVEFGDGSCVPLVDGCDEPSDFIFSTTGQATAAAQSLSDTVFFGRPLGQFRQRSGTDRGHRSSLISEPGFFADPVQAWLLRKRQGTRGGFYELD